MRSLHHQVWLIAFALLTSSVEASIFSRLSEIRVEDVLETRDVVPSAEDLIRVENGVLYSQLLNYSMIPLVGLGVGNLQHDLIPVMVAEALQEDKKSYLIDTSHVSENEAFIAEGILKGVQRLNPDEKIQIHVVTKVWYTHLGYQRTKLAIQESLSAFESVLESGKVDLRFHLLLHWPRCYDSISWMDCQADEASLPQHVKDAGPDPSQNPDAWKESWKFLEDVLLSKELPIESIGVSNFHVQDLQEMRSFARVNPRILQTNLWSLLYDAELIQYCHDHNIHVQVYNALHGIMRSPETKPKAYHHLQKVAVELSSHAGSEVSPAQVILAWLIQHGVSVVPRTSKMDRLAENSAVSLADIPTLSNRQVEEVAHCVEAYLSGHDLEQDVPVTVVFHATTKDIMVYWLGHVDEIRLAHVKKGGTFNETTYHGHVFRLYDTQDKDIYMDHKIEASAGYHQTLHVDLLHHGVRAVGSDSRSYRSQDEQREGNVLNWLGGMLKAKA